MKPLMTPVGQEQNMHSKCHYYFFCHQSSLRYIKIVWNLSTTTYFFPSICGPNIFCRTICLKRIAYFCELTASTLLDIYSATSSSINLNVMILTKNVADDQERSKTPNCKHYWMKGRWPTPRSGVRAIEKVT